MVKLNASDWGDGLGNAVVRCSRLLEMGDLQRSVETLLQPWDTYCRELQDGGAIVEEYVDVATCWPSAQGRVDGDGVLHLLAIHEQILVAGEYRGCAFPVRPDLAHPLADAMARIGATLVGHGVRGSFGVDFIAANGRIYATEVNLRKVGPSHVIATLHALSAEREGAPGNGGIIGLPVAYVHRRLYRPEVLKTLTPQSALTALRRNGPRTIPRRALARCCTSWVGLQTLATWRRPRSRLRCRSLRRSTNRSRPHCAPRRANTPANRYGRG